MTNLGAGRTGWAVTFTLPGNQRITSAWSATVTQSGSQVTARNASWNGALPTGATATFGFQATYSGTNGRPDDIRLDGAGCTITA